MGQFPTADDKGIRHIRGRAYRPMTQGKIERYHRSMTNRILLENYYQSWSRLSEQFFRFDKWSLCRG